LEEDQNGIREQERQHVLIALMKSNLEYVFAAMCFGSHAVILQILWSFS
jgi:hypothetical protein